MECSIITALQKENAELKRQLEYQRESQADHVYAYGKVEEINGFMIYSSIIIDKAPREFLASRSNKDFRTDFEDHFKKLGEFISYDFFDQYNDQGQRK